MALAKVQQQLRHHNVGLKIWDAYRPYSVTEKMWEPLKDERYVANPKYGSGHNRGVAVDLTLVDVTTGKELDMGTGFDHFSDTAHVSFKALSANVLANRALLQQHMEAAGFVVLETEWWHFYIPDTRKYALLNLTFRQLKKINRSQKIH
jgi:D-alanyl-D-alanine dipeptidase